MDLIQKILIQQNVTTGPPMYEWMERVLKGDAKAEFLKQASLQGSLTVENFTTVMNLMTAFLSVSYLPTFSHYVVAKK